MNIIIREARIEDAYQKGFVHYTSWMETYDGLMPKEYLNRLKLETFIMIAEKYPENTLVVEVNGKIVGFAGYLEDASDFASIKPASEIMALYVLKDYQKKGIGYKLIKEALNRLTKNNIVLFVLEGNTKAINFYKKLGFNFTGHKVISDVVGGKLIDLEMLLER